MSQNNLYLLHPGSGNNAPDLEFPCLDPSGSLHFAHIMACSHRSGSLDFILSGWECKGVRCFLAFPWVLTHSLSPKRPISPYFPRVNIPTQLVVKNKGELVWHEIWFAWYFLVYCCYTFILKCVLVWKITYIRTQVFMSPCWRKFQVKTLQMVASFL